MMSRRRRLLPILFRAIAPVNLVVNDGFEVDTAGWGSVASSTVTRTTGEKVYGAAAAQVETGASTSSGIGQSLSQAAVDGKTYTASMWVNVPNAKAMRLRLLDGAAALLATTNFTGTGVWQRVSVTANATADKRVAVQLLRNDGLTTVFTFYIDGVRIEASPFATG
jgi:hypothetical protein